MPLSDTEIIDWLIEVGMSPGRAELDQNSCLRTDAGRLNLILLTVGTHRGITRDTLVTTILYERQGSIKPFSRMSFAERAGLGLGLS